MGESPNSTSATFGLFDDDDDAGREWKRPQRFHSPSALPELIDVHSSSVPTIDYGGLGIRE